MMDASSRDRTFFFDIDGKLYGVEYLLTGPKGDNFLFMQAYNTATGRKVRANSKLENELMGLGNLKMQFEIV